MSATLQRAPGPGAARLAEYERLGGTATEAGVMSQSGGPAGQHPLGGGTVAEVLAKQEHGIGVPRRSVLLATIANRRSDLRQVVREAIGHEHAADAVSARIGGFLVAAFKMRIHGQIPPALSPYTLKRRRERGNVGTTPLDDTGTILASLHWRHVPRGG